MAGDQPTVALDLAERMPGSGEFDVTERPEDGRNFVIDVAYETPGTDVLSTVRLCFESPQIVIRSYSYPTPPSLASDIRGGPAVDRPDRSTFHASTVYDLGDTQLRTEVIEAAQMRAGGKPLPASMTNPRHFYLWFQSMRQAYQVVASAVSESAE